MLYRLDFIDGDREPVRNATGDDFLSRHMTTARAFARATAAATERAIQISRIDNAGRVRPSLVIHPDGLSTRPEGTKVIGAGGDCRKGQDDNVVCFCANCRAARRGR